MGTTTIPCARQAKTFEPLWLHGKRRVIEPARRLSAAESTDRVRDAVDLPHGPHPVIPQDVACSRTTWQVAFEGIVP
jgi:hypothetical protein